MRHTYGYAERPDISCWAPIQVKHCLWASKDGCANDSLAGFSVHWHTKGIAAICKLKCVPQGFIAASVAQDVVRFNICYVNTSLLECSIFILPVCTQPLL